MSANDLAEFDWEDIRREFGAAVRKRVDRFSTEREGRMALRIMVERILAIHDRATQRHTRDHLETFLKNSLDRKSRRVRQSAPDINA